jgi:hypothetical protein
MNMNNMTRFLSKREKDWSSHKRDKSRDKSADRKVWLQDLSSKLSLVYWYSFNASTKRAFTAPASFASISAAFKNPHGKSVPYLKTTIFPVHAAISADKRPVLYIQIRPTSSESLLPNFLKSDSPKKVADKEAQTQVRTYSVSSRILLSESR